MTTKECEMNNYINPVPKKDCKKARWGSLEIVTPLQDDISRL